MPKNGRSIDGSVAEVVSARLRSGSRRDGCTLAVVMEGGGMRGVISAAMAGQLELAGVRDIVDVVVGTSAGAVNAACFTAGMSQQLSRCYVDTFSSSDYANPRALLRGRPIADSAKIVADTETRFGFGAAALNASCRLAAVATDIDAAAPRLLTDFADAADLFGALQASATLPVFGGAPVHYRHTRWLDGGITDAIPIAAAAELGATHAIVLTTRAAGATPSIGMVDHAIASYLRRLKPALAVSYLSRPERYTVQRAALDSGWCQGVATTVIAPDPRDPVPSRLDRNPDRLEAARAAAVQAARAMVRTWTPVR
ncbi:patatin-like phospholipase family protein [Mycobacterium sp. pW045]|uniref:patatin-like phospholipase family protein n=1 Tax=Mycobacterium sp. pW045 TaxID=3238984 RepID=UPI00351B02AC